MPQERYYYKGPLNVGDLITLSSEEERHMRVMRTRPGDEVEIINGQGILAKAIYQDKLEIQSIVQQEECKHKVIIAQGIPRSNRLDLIIEKGTELGASEFWLFPGDLSEKTEIGNSLFARLEAITISASKQSGRLFIPKVEIKPPLKQWKSLPHASYFGDTDPNAEPFIKAWKQEESLIFFIGPEKGFSAKEETHLKSMGASGVKLHPNILRTDTASLALLSIIHHSLL